ncbi:putative ABC-type transport system, ATPase component [Vibrio nigripulchritudo MADA3029]|nr:putative ABC-type transport system, ATPase component [Vibrio nigripulchritudo MADA3021]CCN61575.1 putative ABC-type transport system, ATPase component [Vibrio nigripulchritudo MADA3029]
MKMYAEALSFTTLAKDKAFIAIENGELQYLDAETPTLADLNMRFPVGYWTCILGKSGCGKSTLLRHFAGLLDTKASWKGALQLEDQQGIKRPLSVDNEIAYMGQQDLLMPWLSALDNVLFSTRFGKQLKDKESQQKALHLLEQVGLADQRALLPQQLSGGMRQRVAIARTLMQEKPIVLMDEPFSALDAVNRHKLQNLAHQLLQDKTVLLITHDPHEAIRLASKLYVMQGAPAFAHAMELPQSDIPRKLDAECAKLQQSIIEKLEKDYE